MVVVGWEDLSKASATAKSPTLCYFGYLLKPQSLLPQVDQFVDFRFHPAHSLGFLLFLPPGNLQSLIHVAYR